MRIRLTFSKSGAMQYVGHLDLHRAWERIFRRSGLPLEYSQGFHPQPHINLACALPLGFTSQCEIIDAWFEKELRLADVREAILGALPPGLMLLGISEVDSSAPALQTQVTAAIYQITFLDDIPDLPDRLHRVLSTEHLHRIRHAKPYDLRPLIEEASLLPDKQGEKSKMLVRMAAREAATGRPEELLAEMDIEFKDTLIDRAMLILTND